MITFLSGGTGTPKLIQGFRNFLHDEDIVVIANSADDIWLNGLYISPDIDTILYLFSGILDEEKYWGIKNDTYNTLDFLKQLGFPSWFNIGDRDLAIHLIRTNLVRNGYSQVDIIERLSNELGVDCTILPCSKNHIETRIITEHNEDIHFQEFWVKHRANVKIKEIYIKNIEKAQVPDATFRILDESDLIIIGPSNPVTSIGPIIKMNGMKEALSRNKTKTIAISPIIGNSPISGPTSVLMKAEGKDVSVNGIADMYKEFCDALIIDVKDSEYVNHIEKKSNIKVFQENIMFNEVKDASNLAESILRRKKLFERYKKNT